MTETSVVSPKRTDLTGFLRLSGSCRWSLPIVSNCAVDCAQGGGIIPLRSASSCSTSSIQRVTEITVFRQPKCTFFLAGSLTERVAETEEVSSKRTLFLGLLSRPLTAGAAGLARTLPTGADRSEERIVHFGAAVAGLRFDRA